MKKRMRPLLITLCVLVGGNAVAQAVDPPDYFDPERFEADIQAFERMDSAAAFEPVDVVFYGSSSIRMWHDSLAVDMAPLPVVGRGFGGSTMIDALNYADRVVIPRRPRAIVLYEGDNDVGQHGVPPERVAELFEAFVQKVRASLPETEIYFVAIKPSPSRWEHWPAMNKTNKLIRDVCEGDPLLHYVDVASPILGVDGTPRREIFLEDMLHLNRDGYIIWKRVVRNAVLE